ncbi:MAG: LysR family transcriptional regulator [Myxococcota bacterium]
MWRPDIRDLECVVAVGEELHFGRAAKRLALSQPALSQRIKRLEEQLELQLVERGAREVSLTPAGTEMVRHARKIVADVDGAVTATRRAESGELEIVLGHRDYVRLPWLPSLILNLVDGAPPVRVVHREVDARAMERGLLERELDVGLLSNDVEHDELVVRTLHCGVWLLVVAADHALAGEERVPLQRLAGERLVMFSRSMNEPLHDSLLDAMRAAGFEPRVVYETSQAMNGPELVRNGVGVFVIASYIQRETPPGCHVVIIDGLPGCRVNFAWHVDNRGAALARFRTELDAHVPRGGHRAPWPPPTAAVKA